MSYTITLQPFGVEFACAGGDTVLEAAFKAGVALRHGCKHGGCGACKVNVLDGYVEHNPHATAISEAEMDADIALLCCAVPAEDLVLELSDDYTAAELTPEFPVAAHAVTLQQLQWVTADIAHLTLALAADDRFGFRPGQYLDIAVAGDASFRAFSMANIPAPDGAAGGAVELLIKAIPGGHFSGYLQTRAQPGDALVIRGPYGQFGIADTGAPMVMIAGGSGMAPILALLRQLAAQQSPRPIQFFYGARRQQDLFWLNEIQALGRHLPAFEFIPALSEADAATDAAGEPWRGATGLITDVVRQRSADSLRGAEGYLCGPPGMIDAAVEVLKSKGMFSSRIRFDKFLSSV